MKFGIFYELSVPRPWAENEVKVYDNALEQVKLADELDNVIDGLSGNDVLFGSTGADTLTRIIHQNRECGMAGMA